MTKFFKSLTAGGLLVATVLGAAVSLPVHADTKDAVVIWSCNNDQSTCYHVFTGLSDNAINYQTLASVTDQSGEDEDFSFSANTIETVLKSDWDIFIAAEETDLSLTPTSCFHDNTDGCPSWIPANDITLNPIGAPSGQHFWSTFADHNFKLFIYDESFVGASMSNFNALTYVPDTLDDVFLMNITNLTGTSATNPATLETVIIEPTIRITSSGLNNITFSAVEPLNVPYTAVSTSETAPGVFTITFQSNFYDRVVFKITDSNNHEYYLRIARTAISGDVMMGPGETGREAYAYVHHKTTESHSNFEVTATVVYPNGTTQQFAMAPTNDWRSPVNGDPIEGFERGAGTNLKQSAYHLTLPVAANSLSGIYFNVKKSGSSSTNYAGTYLGSGRGAFFDLDEYSSSFRKINWNK